MCYPRFNDATVTCNKWVRNVATKAERSVPPIPFPANIIPISTLPTPPPHFLPILNYLFKMSMKAVVYQKPFTLKVEDVPKPKIEHPDDIIVKITTSAICGSDLHMYVRFHGKKLCDF